MQVEFVLDKLYKKCADNVNNLLIIRNKYLINCMYWYKM